MVINMSATIVATKVDDVYGEDAGLDAPQLPARCAD